MKTALCSPINLILEKTSQVPYFTDMRRVLQALEISVADYDWYISDIETNYNSPDFPTDDHWVCGEALQQFLAENEIQFIWAVFSAVPKGLRPPVQNPPYIDGNPRYWKGEEVSPQLNGAIFEIACWDSSATILVGLPPKAAAAFVKAYPDTRALNSAPDAL